MANADFQERVDFVKSYVAKGNKRKEVLAKFVKKWQTSDRTFDRVWKEARKQHKELQQVAKQAADRVYIASAENAAKEAIMSKIERQQILTQIARGEIKLIKPIVIDKEIEEFEIVPDWMDRKAAIAELNKMDGDYAPIRNEHTGKNGEPIETKNYNVSLSKEEIIDISKQLENSV